jgi:short-subunit dehydrogenase
MFAVITGATSGIGAAFAVQLAAEGYRLLLCGRRKEKIAHLAAELTRRYGVETRPFIAELSTPDEVARLAEEVGRLPEVAVLINNAGFGMAGYFTEDPVRHLEMLHVHVTAAMKLIAAAVPSMKAMHRGLIINVSSVAAYFPSPKGSTYSATKRYLITFSESLHMELRSFGIRVQALCPGMTRTDFHMRNEEGREIEKKNIIGWMNPEKVAKLSLEHARRKSGIYVPGWKNKLLVRILSHLPRRLYYRLAASVMP